jgi:hypothetical protein
MEAGLTHDLAWALVRSAGVEAEPGDQQQCRREQEDEEPIGECAGEQPSADCGVALVEAEYEVDGGMARARTLALRTEAMTPLDPRSELSRLRRLGQPENPISAGSWSPTSSVRSSSRTRQSK